jgi:hypothetical protein
MMRLALAGMAVMALVACGERPQTASGGKSHVGAFMGADNQFVAPGWKPGDKTSWEQGLKARAQNSQNEYSKTN